MLERAPLSPLSGAGSSEGGATPLCTGTGREARRQASARWRRGASYSDVTPRSGAARGRGRWVCRPIGRGTGAGADGAGDALRGKRRDRPSCHRTACEPVGEQRRPLRTAIFFSVRELTVANCNRITCRGEEIRLLGAVVPPAVAAGTVVLPTVQKQMAPLAQGKEIAGIDVLGGAIGEMSGRENHSAARERVRFAVDCFAPAGRVHVAAFAAALAPAVRPIEANPGGNAVPIVGILL